MSRALTRRLDRIEATRQPDRGSPPLEWIRSEMSGAEMLAELGQRKLDDFDAILVMRWFNRDTRAHDDWVLSGELE